MRTLDVADPFDSDDMFAINAHKRSEAGIHRSMIKFVGSRINVRNDLKAKPLDTKNGAVVCKGRKTYNSASATTTFCAAQLCPCQTDAPQVFQKRDLRIDGIQDDLGPVEIEADSVIPSISDFCQRRSLVRGSRCRLYDARRHIGSS